MKSDREKLLREAVEAADELIELTLAPVLMDDSTVSVHPEDYSEMFGWDDRDAVEEAATRWVRAKEALE